MTLFSDYVKYKLDYMVKFTQSKNDDWISADARKKYIEYATTIFNIFGLYIIWILIHYISAQLYIKLCVPRTIFGFLLSPFTTATPHCIALRWAIYNGGISISNMWNALGLWFMKHLVSP